MILNKKTLHYIQYMIYAQLSSMHKARQAPLAI